MYNEFVSLIIHPLIKPVWCILIELIELSEVYQISPPPHTPSNPQNAAALCPQIQL